jgi:hypothetical protein
MSDMPTFAEALPGLISFVVGVVLFVGATVALLGIGVIITEVYRYARTHPDIR